MKKTLKKKKKKPDIPSTAFFCFYTPPSPSEYILGSGSDLFPFGTLSREVFYFKLIIHSLTSAEAFDLFIVAVFFFLPPVDHLLLPAGTYAFIHGIVCGSG